MANVSARDPIDLPPRHPIAYKVSRMGQAEEKGIMSPTKFKDDVAFTGPATASYRQTLAEPEEN